MNLVPTFHPPSKLKFIQQYNVHQKLELLFDCSKYNKNFQNSDSHCKPSGTPLIVAISDPKDERSNAKRPQQSSKRSLNKLSLFDGEVTFNNTKVQKTSNKENDKVDVIPEVNPREFLPFPIFTRKTESNENHKDIDNTEHHEVLFDVKKYSVKTDLAHEPHIASIREDDPVQHFPVPPKPTIPRKGSVLFGPKSQSTKSANAEKSLLESLSSTAKSSNPSLPGRNREHSNSVAQKQFVPEASPDSSYFGIEDLKGIQNVCKNAAATYAGISAIKKMIQSSRVVVIGFIWQDLSTNHCPSTTKYCKPSSPCHLWYCACDKVVRSKVLAKNLLGVTFSLDEGNNFFFLPLMSCKEPNTILPSDGKHLPLRSETTLDQRWELFFSMLFNSSLKKIIYHSQVALMPVLYRLGRSVPEAEAAGLYSDTHAPEPFAVNSRIKTFPNLFDSRVAAYLTNSEMSEEKLEMYELFDDYRMEITAITAPELLSGYGRITRLLVKLQSELTTLFRLSLLLTSKIEEMRLMQLLNEIEMPLCSILSAMEITGLAVDTKTVERMNQQLKRQIGEKEEAIYRLSGFKFNIASPEQVSQVLFDKMKLEAPSDMARGHKFISTAEEELKKILHLHPVVAEILSYRSLVKLETTYIEGLVPFISSNSAKSVNSSKLASVHAYWNQTSVRTGRLSCCKPNLQNIPSNQLIDGVNFSVRSFFRAREG
jgi:hypothetical protein